MRADSLKPWMRVVVTPSGKKIHGHAFHPVTKDERHYDPDPNKCGWVVYHDNNQGNGIYRPLDMRSERFMEFCFLPYGFGKTSWYAFALIQVMCFGMVSFAASDEGGAAIAMTFAFLIEALLVFGTWMNFKGRWK